MTVQDVISAARNGALNDPYGGERWADSVLLGYVADGQEHVLSRRPDLRLKADGTLLAVTRPTTLTGSTGTLVLETKWLPALEAYVCWRAFGTDDADRGNREAAQDAWARLEVALRQ